MSLIIIIIILPCFILWGMCCVIVGNMHTSVFAIKIWVLNLFCKWMHYLNCQNIYISNLPHKWCILVLLWNLLNSVGTYSMAFTGSIKPVPLCQKWLPIFPFAVTAGKLKQQKWREKRKQIIHMQSLCLTHTYCSTWFPAATVHPPSLALQPSENTSGPGHSSAGSRRNNDSKDLWVIA